MSSFASAQYITYFFLADSIPALHLHTLCLIKWVDGSRRTQCFNLIERISHKWTDIGDLFKIQDATLKNFKATNLNDNKGGCRDVFVHWLNNGGTNEYPRTWSGVFELLDNIELRGIRMELQQALDNCIV